MALKVWTKTNARRDEKHLSFEIWCTCKLDVWRYLWHFSGDAWYAFANVYMLMSQKKKPPFSRISQTFNSTTAMIIFCKLKQISKYTSLLPFPLFLDKEMFQMNWKKQSSYEDVNIIVSFFSETAIIKLCIDLNIGGYICMYLHN